MIRTCLLIAVFSSFASGIPVQAQRPQPLAKPEELGLLIPRGRTAHEVLGKNVLVSMDQDTNGSEDDKEEPTVANVYLEVGDRYILMMPDGALRSVAKRDTIETDRPFKEIDKDDLAKQLLRQFKGFKTRSTRHYLCIYNTTDEFCEHKTAILETMYPSLVSYFKRQRLPVEKPSIPMVIVMFRTKAEFQRYRKMPETMLAYYNAVSNRVFLYQYSELVKDAPAIAIKQSTSTIAHEGVHQILHNIGVQKRLSNWPIWLSEGMAEYFSPTTTSSRSKWAGVGKPNHLRMRDLFKHFNATRGLGNGDLVKQLVAADQLTATGYASAWALTHYLITKKKKELFSYLRDVSETPQLELPQDELVRFIEHFGSNFAGIEREMVRHIQSLPYRDPVANQPYFLVTAKAGSRKLATVTSSLDHQSVRLKMVAKLNPNQRAKVQFFPVRTFPNRQLAQQAMLLYTR